MYKRNALPAALLAVFAASVASSGCVANESEIAALDHSATAAPVTICQPNTFVASSDPVPDLLYPQLVDGVSISCTPCEGLWQSCAVAGSGNSVVQFTVDGIGGYLRITNGENTERVVFFQEGGGACVPDGQSPDLSNPPLAEALQERGIQTVSVLYVTGYSDGPTGVMATNGLPCTGWFTRSGNSGVGLRELARRPAGLIAWVDDHIAAGRPLGAVGDSAGAVATFSAFYFQGAGAHLDYQGLSGGPGAWDLAAACGAATSAGGVCSENPAQNCSYDFQCSGICLSRYSLGSPLYGFKALMDYIAMNTGTELCTLASASALVRDSSYRNHAAPALAHPLDVFICRSAPLFTYGEDWLGLAAQSGRAYRTVSGDKGWFDFSGCYHGDQVRDPALLDIVSNRIAERL